eukprot:4025957-Ditylum_brightwellii.AAC.1
MSTTKLLFLCKRARRDIQTGVTFLTTWVKEPNEDDWKKVRRIILYLNGTTKLVTTLSVSKLNIATWWVDGSFATHPNMKGHMKMTMSLGEGSVFSSSIKQKLNTKSSTETKLIAVGDAMPHILWTIYFLECQECNVGKAQICLDN